MNIINSIIDTFKGFDLTTWVFLFTCLIELGVILFYNRGVLKCKEKLEQYEDEIRQLKIKVKDQKELLDFYDEEERGE